MSRQFWLIFCYKIDSNNLDVKLELFKKDDKTDFCLVQNFAKGEADFNKFMRRKNLPVKASGNFCTGENLSAVLMPTMSKDLIEHLKLIHKVFDVVDRSNRRSCATLLGFNVDKPESSYAHVRFVTQTKDDEKFQKIVYVKYTLKEFSYLLDLMIFV